MSVEDEEVTYEFVGEADVDDVEYYSTLQPDRVYISFGISENGKPEINIIDMTDEGSAEQQVFMPIAHAFVDFVLENTTEAQRMGIKILTEIEEDATEH